MTDASKEHASAFAAMQPALAPFVITGAAFVSLHVSAIEALRETIAAARHFSPERGRLRAAQAAAGKDGAKKDDAPSHEEVLEEEKERLEEKSEDQIDEAIEESFPASDPPSFNPGAA